MKHTPLTLIHGRRVHIAPRTDDTAVPVEHAGGGVIVFTLAAAAINCAVIGWLASKLVFG